MAADRYRLCLSGHRIVSELTPPHATQRGGGQGEVDERREKGEGREEASLKLLLSFYCRAVDLLIGKNSPVGCIDIRVVYL